jgi:hypothetical protein
MSGIEVRIGYRRDSQDERYFWEDQDMWMDTTEMDLREICWGSMDVIYVAQDRCHWGGGGGCCEHGNESLGSIKCWEVLT